MTNSDRLRTAVLSFLGELYVYRRSKLFSPNEKHINVEYEYCE